MFKSFFIGALALLSAIFGLPHAQVPTTPISVAPVTKAVTVVNHVSKDPITLVANTRFETEGHLIFRSLRAITIPGKRGAADGMVEVMVVADRSGPQYDIGAASLTLPGLAANPTLHRGIYAYTSGVSPQPHTASAPHPSQAPAAPSNYGTRDELTVQAISSPSVGYITQDGLTASLNTAIDGLKTIIYGSLPNSSARSISGLTSGDVPDLSSKYLSINNGTSTARTNLGLAYATASDIDAYNIAAWGDSLTQGAGGGGEPYTAQLSVMLGNRPVYNGGVGGDTSTQIMQRELADTAMHSYTTTIWAGRNNFSAAATVEADIATMVSSLGHNRYLILSVLNGPAEPSGTSNYNAIIQLNNDLAALYPNNYLDVRAYLVSQYNPSLPQDVIDSANDVPPTSLRSFSVHLNQAGYTIVAQQVANFITANGWGSGAQSNVLTTGLSSAAYQYIRSSGDNLFVGNASGANTLGGYGIQNTALGQGALEVATSSSYNTAIGYMALFNNTGGISNTAVGAASLYNTTTGTGNSASGFQALYNNTTGSYNTANGGGALSANTTGSYNIANGYQALYYNTTGNYNAVNGTAALFRNTTGSNNVVDGYHALYDNITGMFNVISGTRALFYNTSATSSVAVGYLAGQGTDAYFNQGGTYVGYQSGYSAANSSDYNTFLGYQSGYGVTVGAQNILLGPSTILASQNQVTTGSANIAIGDNVAVASSTLSNQLNIGNFLYGTGLSGTGANVSNGLLGIGVMNPANKLDVNGGVAIGTYAGSAGVSNGLIVSGNVGIGTTTPSSLLSLTGNSSVVTIASTIAATTLQIENSNTTDNNFAALSFRGIDANGAEFTGAKIAGIFTDHTAGASSGGIAFLTMNAGVGGEKMRITAAGSVGIGTSSPSSVFAISSSAPTLIINDTRSFSPAVGTTIADLQFRSDDLSNSLGGATRGSVTLVSEFNATGAYTGLAFLTNNGTTLAEKMRITNTGNVGIGTTTPHVRLEVWGPDSAATTSAFAVINNASTAVFSVYDNGNATYSGSIFQSSDQRLKTDIQSLDASSSLAAIGELNPVSYSRLDQIGQGVNLGFIAQQVANVFPQLVSTTSATALTPDGTLTLNYVGLIAPMVKAIQSIAQITGAFKDALIAWLGNASNGIHDLYATVIHAHQVVADQLCAGTVCVNQQQLAAILATTGQASAPLSVSGQGSGPIMGNAASSTSATPTTPPVISINGDNPALIHVGDTYSDLGATITGPAEDLNLGIHIFVGDTPIGQAVVDTSVPATYHIYYVANDAAGNTATSTRTVTVEAASIPALEATGTAATVSTTP